MWALIYPVCAMPLLITLLVAGRRAERAGSLASFKTPFQSLGARQLVIELFWQLDIIGIILIIAVFSLILVPLTLAGGEQATWKTAHIITPLVIGVLTIPVFIQWEKRCKHPMVPFPLLKDRGVWGALGIAIMLNTAWYLQGDYLYTVLIVAFGESIKSATRISSLYSFVSVLTGLGVGIVVRFVHYLKPFIVAGTALFSVAFGLLINYRGGATSSSHSGIIGAQVLLGIAGGLFPYTAQASIQSATKHERKSSLLLPISTPYFPEPSKSSTNPRHLRRRRHHRPLPRKLLRRFSPRQRHLRRHLDASPPLKTRLSPRYRY